MDSVTRFAMAQREVGLAAGEPPATLAGIPRASSACCQGFSSGAVVASVDRSRVLYTVLVEGDDINEPIADTTRSILDWRHLGS